MKQFNSILDIIGPRMIGPSSSHTAGAVKLGNIARNILSKKIKKVRIVLYNSFAETGAGHGTHKAILAGLMGFSWSDKRIKHAEKIAAKAGIKTIIEKYVSLNDYPPNTARIDLFSEGLTTSILGISSGGGAVSIIQIDGFDVDITGDLETAVITHSDKLGILSEILHAIAVEKINVISINSSRKNKMDDVHSVITFDSRIRSDMKRLLMKLNSVKRVRIIHKIRDSWL